MNLVVPGNRLLYTYYYRGLEMEIDMIIFYKGSISDFSIKIELHNITDSINTQAEKEIGDHILSSLFNDLSEEYTDRLALIEQSTNLRKRVLKNPIYSALDKISEQILGTGEKIFSLIEREEKEIGKKASLQDYVLSD
jgi:hypothetical protein